MRKTVAAPAFGHFHDAWHLSPVLDTGEFIFLSGITGCHPDYSVSDDPEKQFRDAFRFLGDNLAAADLTFQDIVEITTYHVHLRQHLEAFTKVKDEFVKPPYPAWSAIGTTELITEGTLVEIRVICQRSHRI